MIIPVIVLDGCSSIRNLQNEKSNDQIQKVIESEIFTSGNLNNTANLTSLEDNLLELAENPVNINTADIDELLSIPMLKRKIARAIIDYRNNVKPFETKEEIKNVKGIGNVTYLKLKPFITVGSEAEKWKSVYNKSPFWTNNSHLSLISRFQRIMQNPLGYARTSGTRYAGNPVRYYERATYSSNHMTANLTLEKDPGEVMDGKLGFDYSSGSLSMKDIGLIRKIVLGDYRLSFGQGLVLWNGSSFGKGSDVTGGPVKNSTGIRGYRSSDENHFFRGLGLTIGEKWQNSIFISDRNFSSSVISGDTVRFSSMTGLYRTSTERERRYNNRNVLLGGHSSYAFRNGVIGATGYVSEFDKYIEHGTAMYQRNDFQGREAASAGVDFDWFPGKLDWSGEIAISRNSAKAFVSSISYPIGKQTDIIILYRNYSPRFHAIFGNGFGDQSGAPQNESGWYLGIQKEFKSGLVIGSYIDEGHYPAPKYLVNEPSGGFDWLGTIDIDLTKEVNLSFLARYKTSARNYSSVDPFGRDITLVGQEKRMNFRLLLEVQSSASLRLRTRFETGNDRLPGTNVSTGFLMSQDVRWYPLPSLRIDTRYALFDTDDYQSRLYEYENGLQGTMSIPAFFGKGRRWYILIKYSPLPFCDLWLKYGVTTYEHKRSIGSGLDQIPGNMKSHIGLMIRLKW